MENKGIFLYLDSISALDALYSDALKWRIVRAVCMYAALGELPDEKLQKNTVFLLLKSMVDNGKNGPKRKKGGLSGEEVESLNNTDIKAVSCGDKKSGDGGDKNIFHGEEKLNINCGTLSECENYNKNKNKNENKNRNENKNSSSSLVSGEKVRLRTEEKKKLEEEKKERVSVIGYPTLSEVQEFISITKVKVDPVCFYEYHIAKNWRVGGRPISDWRACVLEWDRKERRKELREKEKEEEKKNKGLTRNYTEEDRKEVEGCFISLEKIDKVDELFK